ncbi:TPA_asm: hypothetical protein [Altiarchaeum virus]|nr:MAG: hypothetical protein BWK75_06320 [Candidatus Altiarchaeales archaeon A3]DAZ85559.1 TPA_asm: hypothetical protein [Altiarchaeum virus]
MKNEYKYLILNNLYEIQKLQNSKKQGVEIDFLAKRTNKTYKDTYNLCYQAKRNTFINMCKIKERVILVSFTKRGLDRIKWIRKQNNQFIIY